MTTLYVENVPADLYEALRERAKRNRRSIAGEVIILLELNVPTKKSLKSRTASGRLFARLRSRKSPGKGPFPTTEELLRADRER